MKPYKKPQPDQPEEPIPALSKVARKINKPWILESNIHDPGLLNSWSIGKDRKLDVWVKDAWLSGYTKPEIILEQMNKIARTYNHKNEPIKQHWRFHGREFRIYNIDTQEIIKLKLTDKEVIKDE